MDGYETGFDAGSRDAGSGHCGHAHAHAPEPEHEPEPRPAKLAAPGALCEEEKFQGFCTHPCGKAIKSSSFDEDRKVRFSLDDALAD